MAKSWFEEHCPRLAKARDDLIAERRERFRLECLRRAKQHELEWVVAHRELQLVRAFHTRNRRYIAKREQMLKEAQARLRAVQKKAA